MNTTDTNGRPWAKLSELKPGDLIKLDSGFDCHSPGIVEVEHSDDGLYFKCGRGRHYLVGQISESNNDSLVGIYPVRP